MPLDDTNETDPTIALLIRARGFIERGWCRQALARDATGVEIDPTDQKAAMWDIAGALHAAGLPRSDPDRRAHPAVRRLKTIIVNVDFTLFNDTQETVEPVLAAFDRAINQSRSGD